MVPSWSIRSEIRNVFLELLDPRTALDPDLHPSRLAGFDCLDSMPKEQILLALGAPQLHLVGSEPKLINPAGSWESAMARLEHVCVCPKWSWMSEFWLHKCSWPPIQLLPYWVSPRRDKGCNQHLLPGITIWRLASLISPHCLFFNILN